MLGRAGPGRATPAAAAGGTRKMAPRATSAAPERRSAAEERPGDRASARSVCFRVAGCLAEPPAAEQPGDAEEEGEAVVLEDAAEGDEVAVDGQQQAGHEGGRVAEELAAPGCRRRGRRRRQPGRTGAWRSARRSGRGCRRRGRPAGSRRAPCGGPRARHRLPGAQPSRGARLWPRRPETRSSRDRRGAAARRRRGRGGRGQEARGARVIAPPTQPPPSCSEGGARAPRAGVGALAGRAEPQPAGHPLKSPPPVGDLPGRDWPKGGAWQHQPEQHRRGCTPPRRPAGP